MTMRLKSLCKWPPNPHISSESVSLSQPLEKYRLFQVLAVNGTTVSFMAVSLGLKLLFSFDAATPEMAANIASALLDNLGMTVMDLGSLTIEA
jgi:hypothetical protein